ncbi:hypothetical protein [Actomonas aquatica]|uniref:EF-hand domain-containing protein n=1 Tax=Actomonas aquatica TaxID=2866162 RepID=A0ABZ1CC61_9BACT|nr:hypothetical protein [Opitutus sp. WL0086]WRQ89073.1 hypothetical protein K1X11_006610 [Opitutus sp. WL0086]
MRSAAIATLALSILALPQTLLSWDTVLQFPNDEGLWGYPRSSPADNAPSPGLATGENGVIYHAVFGADTARNPTRAYPAIEWDTPPLFGGYMLYSENHSNGSFGPNFVCTISASANGHGAISLPVTEIIKTGTTGTLTNVVLGTLVTPTAISGDGEFRILLLEKTYDHPMANGGIAEFRGAAFDGNRWLVTADAASDVPNTGVKSVMVSTRSGWHVLDTTSFTYDAETTTAPAGPLTQAGVWFMAEETSAPAEAGFQFGVSDSYFTARVTPTVYHPDEDGDNQISLSELLNVIELYNSRSGSTRTGRYDTNFAADSTSDPTAIALYETYYAADTDRDGTISLSELLRVIELYNVREGTTRVGRYHLDSQFDDGVAPGAAVVVP